MFKKVNFALGTLLIGAAVISPANSYAAIGDTPIKPGSSSNDVKELQEYLMAKHVFPYTKATGYFGSITEKSVKEIQKKYHLKEDGIAGKKTAGILKILRKGDMGRPVIKLQRLLSEWDLLNGSPDGLYGASTADAVKRFQKKKGLAADGIAGPKTMAKLAEKQAKKQVKTMTVTSTAYTANCQGCSGVTKIGMDLKKYSSGKVIAVDPDVIPLGSVVEVEGYGKAIAGDIGGAINGKEIDVFTAENHDAMKWGRKPVKITVYE
ncbi:peptidoglycan-binding protein [Metabacillus sp. GX 13764]|uniref:peptidoglycan-binding protein n=1 Tax=Metabacillus kandeliae TaxID=2900151 RepID=UPI001E63A61A|nr:peptidoglycan-binding protein [Metabacillus kandeliae]MCD7036138.1 peptidoglycan-binding protein [Metabacillus kandeliae]